MLQSNPFTEAKPFLWDGCGPELEEKQRYLCHCLLLARIANRIDRRNYVTAKLMIHLRLGAEFPLIESFLGAGLGVPLSQLTPENVQAYRLRWLTQLESDWAAGIRE